MSHEHGSVELGLCVPRDRQPPAGAGVWSSHPPIRRQQQPQGDNVQNPIFLPCHDNPFFFPLSPDLEAQAKP